jgi:hypothetical protein
VERPRACSTDVHDAAAEWRHISIWPPSTPPSWELRWRRPPAGDAANCILGTAGDRWYYHPLGFALVFVPLPSYRSRSLRFLLQDAPWSDSGSTPALRCQSESESLPNISSNLVNGRAFQPNICNHSNSGSERTVPSPATEAYRRERRAG